MHKQIDSYIHADIHQTYLHAYTYIQIYIYTHKFLPVCRHAYVPEKKRAHIHTTLGHMNDPKKPQNLYTDFISPAGGAGAGRGSVHRAGQARREVGSGGRVGIVHKTSLSLAKWSVEMRLWFVGGYCIWWVLYWSAMVSLGDFTSALQGGKVPRPLEHPRNTKSLNF